MIGIASLSGGRDTATVQVGVGPREPFFFWTVQKAGLGYKHDAIWRCQILVPNICGMERAASLIAAAVGGPSWAWELVGKALEAAIASDAQLQAEFSRGVREERERQVHIRANERLRADRKFRSAPCFVYLMESEGKLKIGMSQDPEGRAQVLSTSGGQEVRLVAKHRYSSRGEAGRAESELHERFADHRLLGEWFRDVPEIRSGFSVAPVVEPDRWLTVDEAKGLGLYREERRILLPRVKL